MLREIGVIGADRIDVVIDVRELLVVDLLILDDDHPKREVANRCSDGTSGFRGLLPLKPPLREFCGPAPRRPD
ncbi:hypothetical protein GCM10010253_20660 [Streptomyces badius]|uniref:Uncharacterized protein n=1 Tax=Streptomyces badius TaxID=1941 RepID=A0ABQ2T442_STRBA|nr:hypothetical protein GCM10010253_20660 [Streptomyces badius]